MKLETIFEYFPLVNTTLMMFLIVAATWANEIKVLLAAGFLGIIFQLQYMQFEKDVSHY